MVPTRHAEKWHLRCIAGADYEAIRAQAHRLRVDKVEEVRGLVSKLQKAQRAAEDALDLCDGISNMTCACGFLPVMSKLDCQVSSEMFVGHVYMASF